MEVLEVEPLEKVKLALHLPLLLNHHSLLHRFLLNLGQILATLILVLPLLSLLDLQLLRGRCFVLVLDNDLSVFDITLEQVCIEDVLILDIQPVREERCNVPGL